METSTFRYTVDNLSCSLTPDQQTQENLAIRRNMRRRDEYQRPSYEVVKTKHAEELC